MGLGSRFENQVLEHVLILQTWKLRPRMVKYIDQVTQRPRRVNTTSSQASARLTLLHQRYDSSQTQRWAASPQADPHLHSRVQELSHASIAAARELVSRHPPERILDVLVINENEFLSLAKAFGDKGCQPIWVKRETSHEGGFVGRGSIVYSGVWYQKGS